MLRATGSTASFPMEIALAHSATPGRLRRLQSHKPWLVSRKLDGIRCIVIVSLDCTGSHPRVAEVYTLSRSGRPLESLGPFRRQLCQDLEAYPDLGALAGPPDSHGQAQFVLDGELCALRPTEDARGETYVEDFLHTLSVVRRHTDSPTPIILFPFDCMPLDAFVRWRAYLEQGRAPPLQERLAPLRALVDWCLAQRRDTCLRHLEQVSVSDLSSLDRLLQQATDRQWEGLMVRGDRPYEGRRTSSLLKLRDTQEAEYVVRDVVVTTMRLPVQGHYEERPALSRRSHADRQMSSLSTKARASRSAPGSRLTSGSGTARIPSRSAARP